MFVSSCTEIRYKKRTPIDRVLFEYFVVFSFCLNSVVFLVHSFYSEIFPHNIFPEHLMLFEYQDSSYNAVSFPHFLNLLFPNALVHKFLHNHYHLLTQNQFL